MWFITHTAVGGALGSRIRRPLWIVMTFALLSHLILDFIPHWDYPIGPGQLINPIIDILLGVTLSVLLIRGTKARLACVLGIAFSALPDFEGVLQTVGLISRYYFPSHTIPFMHNKAGLLWGVPVQIIIILVAIFVVRNSRSS